MKNDFPIIIAEAGVNHNGSLEMAMRLVDAAKEAGADYVKFQTFKAEKLVTVSAGTADYQKNNCNAENQLQMLRNLQLSYEEFIKLSDYCKNKGIGFLSTPFDMESIDFLTTLGMDYMKVPSGEITNLPYLRKIASTGIPVIISTGMSDYEEIESAIQPFKEADYQDSQIILLHCNTQYPTPFEDVNLRAMAAMAEKYNLKTGYSDHTRGIEIPIAATALGAAVIEKHFTLDRNLPGPDHKASLEPKELSQMVDAVRNVMKALGSPHKKVTESEKSNLNIARKSIVASRKIKSGEIFSEANLTAKRPGSGISPMLWDSLIGKKSKKDYQPDDMIDSCEMEPETTA